MRMCASVCFSDSMAIKKSIEFHVYFRCIYAYCVAHFQAWCATVCYFIPSYSQHENQEMDRQNGNGMLQRNTMIQI